MRLRQHDAISWGTAERERLRQAREHAGHTEKACANVLREQFGIPTARQANVSRWETGAIRQPTCASQLLAYCDTYGPPSDGGATSGAKAVVGDPAERHPDSSATSTDSDDVEEFHRLAAHAAGEPLLGPMQTELVSGMSQRLRNGPALSPEDRATYVDQLRILGIDRS